MWFVGMLLDVGCFRRDKSLGVVEVVFVGVDVGGFCW